MTGRAPVRRALLAAVGFYSRAISPALPPRCRFYPTCSAYAAEAIERHGAARGSWLTLRRLAKCAPWHPGGWDPVPPSTGTDGHDHASSTAEPSPGPGAPHAEPPATPPAHRAVQEESTVV